MFDQIDEFLLDRVFQRISDHIQVQTGRTNFWTATQAFIIALAMMIIHYAMDILTWIQEGMPSLSIGHVALNFFILGMFGLLTVHFVKGAPDAERRAMQGRGMNPARLTYRISRATCVIMLPCVIAFVIPIGITIDTFLGVGALAAYTAGLYFWSCSPMPPTQNTSRIGRFAESFGG